MTKKVGLSAKTESRTPARTADDWVSGVGERAAAVEVAPDR
jgi:hypothetical protein